jgi:hypothetical protein
MKKNGFSSFCAKKIPDHPCRFPGTFHGNEVSRPGDNLMTRVGEEGKGFLQIDKGMIFTPFAFHNKHRTGNPGKVRPGIKLHAPHKESRFRLW